MSESFPRVPAAAVAGLINDAFVAGGLSPAHAAKVAELMTEADLTGADGHDGMVHLVMSLAVDTAIDLARETGVSWVGVRRSNHAGPAGLYAEMPVKHGMISLYAAIANANHMAV